MLTLTFEKDQKKHKKNVNCQKLLEAKVKIFDQGLIKMVHHISTYVKKKKTVR